MIDLRLPSGLLFIMFGIILCAVGLWQPGARAPLSEANVNLYCGSVMLVFGGLMLWLSRRSN